MKRLRRLFTRKPEKREHPRHACDIDISYHLHGRLIRRHVRNISIGGLYLASGDALQSGQTVALTIPLSLIEATLSFEGVITRKDNEGFAIRFGKLSSKDKRLIRQFVDSLAGDETG